MSGHPKGAAGRRATAFALFLTVAFLASLVPAPAASAAAPGTPYTWGANTYGQLGDGTTSPHLAPMPVNGITGAIDVAAGREHALALMPDGTVRTWGHNNFGQIGDGSSSNRLNPVTVPGLSGVIDVAAGHYHSLALRSDGTVRAWGYNAFGQLGDGSTTNRRSPVTVAGLTGVVTIAGGRDMSYAIRSDGTLWAWGLNSDGEIGDGTTTTRTTPVRVGTLTSVVGVAGGRDHGLALRSDGTVWAWGDNAYGQVGDGTLVDKRSPVQVAGLTNIVALSAGAFHSLALRSDGTVVGWGRNNLGQLGDGTATQRRTPVSVSGLTGVSSIGAGRDAGFAALGDGTVRSWGRNETGQLGDGTMTDHHVPVTVTGLTDVEEVHGGAEYTLALRSDGPPPPPDTDPPTAPGQPSGTSSSPGTIALTWSAAVDNVSTTLTYHVFRDGLSAGAVTSAGAVVGFTDVGLQAGDSHVYTVTAVDAANNEGPASLPSDPIVVAGGPTAIFSDDFSSGTLANWSSITRFAIDTTVGSLAPPSARVSVSNQTATMIRALGGSYSNICLSVRLNVSARTGTVGLWRLRTAANGPIARGFLTDTGILSIRSDVSGVTRSSAVALGTGWHTLEMCGTVGTAGTWDLYRDGVRIVNAWVANTGTVPVGMIELGNTNAGTWTVNFDDIQVDQSPGG